MLCAFGWEWSSVFVVVIAVQAGFIQGKAFAYTSMNLATKMPYSAKGLAVKDLASRASAARDRIDLAAQKHSRALLFQNPGGASWI